MNAHSNGTERGLRSALRPPGNPSTTLRSVCALLMAVGGLTLASVGALAEVLIAPLSIQDFSSPNTFSFQTAAPLVGLTGMVQVTTSVIGVFADGARGGAALMPFSANLVTGGLVDSSNVFHAVNNVGGAASFVGDG